MLRKTRRPKHIVVIVSTLTLLRCFAAGGDTATDGLTAPAKVIEAWKDMRFGMFLCWGPVSLTGKEIGWSRGTPSWGRRPGVRGAKGPTPVDVYDNLYKRWEPDSFDPERWVRLAKETGMQYLIFLVKHHDGFSLYDTKLTDFRSTGPASAWKVDVLKHVAAACRKHDLKLILYYSQPDWHHPDYLTPNHRRYIEYLHGQIKELLTNYGRIDGLWFDGLRARGEDRQKNTYEGAELWDAEKLYRMARRLQPHIVINNRAGLPGDFDTPENRVGFYQPDRPWETNATLTGQWAWKPDDPFFRSFEEVIHMLVCVVTGDGNFALNTGPMPDGRVEPRQVERFREIGRWMKRYGESVCGTRGGPYIAPDEKTRGHGGYYAHFTLPGGRWWGGSTHRGATVYLHILRWPSGSLLVPAQGRTLKTCTVMTGGSAAIEQRDDSFVVSIAPEHRHPEDTIVRLEFDRAITAATKPAIAEPCAETTVRESRLDGGETELRVVDRTGAVKATYRINLSKHHKPTTSRQNPGIAAWETSRFGAFLCFNSNQFTGREFCTTRDPRAYDPPVVDVKQWITTFKAAGMTHAVLTARHTSGFLLWDSPTSELDVAASGNPTDVVGAYVVECRRQGLRPGLYYCLWGGKKCPVSGSRELPEARGLILAQLYELATRYGPIPYFWIDMKNWAPANLSTQEIYDTLKNINPHAVILFNQHIQDGREIKYFPTDVLDGEMQLPPAGGHVARRTIDDIDYYLPLEMNMTSQSWAGGSVGGMYSKYSWFTYGAGKSFTPSSPFPAAFLYRYMKRGYAQGASTVLLACAPDHTGRMREADVRQLVLLGRMLKDPSLAPTEPITFGGRATASGVWPNPHLPADLAIDDNLATRWGGAPDSKSGWLAVDLGKEKTFSHLWVSEAYDRVRRFELQVERSGIWQTILTGTTLGANFSVTFEPVTARKVRLNILEATDVPTIWEVQLFAE